MINFSLGTDAQKLRALATWLDKYDDDIGYTGERDVQADLRRIADDLESSESACKCKEQSDTPCPIHD